MFDFVCCWNDTYAVLSSLQNLEGDTALHSAAQYGHNQVVDLLLQVTGLKMFQGFTFKIHVLLFYIYRVVLFASNTLYNALHYI